MGAIAAIAIPLLQQYGPIIAGKLLKLAFPDDPTISQWLIIFDECKAYDEMRAAAFKAAALKNATVV